MACATGCRLLLIRGPVFPGGGVEAEFLAGEGLKMLHELQAVDRVGLVEKRSNVLSIVEQVERGDSFRYAAELGIAIDDRIEASGARCRQAVFLGALRGRDLGTEETRLLASAPLWSGVQRRRLPNRRETQSPFPESPAYGAAT